MLDKSLRRFGIDPEPLNSIRWSKWILIIATIGAAAYVGMYSQRYSMFGHSGFEIILTLIVFVIVSLLIFYRIELGVLAIVLAAFFVRFEVPTGSNTNLPASLVISGVVVVIWVISMLVKRQVRLMPGPYVKPALIFMALSLFSVPYSWLILNSEVLGVGRVNQSGLGFSLVQIGGVTLMVLLPAVMLMTANVLNKEVWFKVLFAIVVIVAIPELLDRVGLLSVGFGRFHLDTGKTYALWVVALTVGQAFFNTSLRPLWRIALLAVAASWLYYGAELGATWFSGWMPAAVALMFMIFVRSKKLFALVLFAGLFMFLLRSDHYIEYIWEDAVNMDSNRFEIWQIIIFDLTLTKTNLLFGAGPAGYLPFFERYYPGAAWSSHNNYVDIFAEVGLVGFSVFVWMLVGIFVTGWQQRNEMPTPFLRAFNYSVLGGFCGILFAMGLGDWHIPFVYNVGIPGFNFAVYGWLLTGAMLALNRMRVVSPQKDG